MSVFNHAYKVRPIPNPRIWGTDRLASLVHLPPSKATYGEIYLVSSMEGAQCLIDGQDFDTFYQSHPEFFNLRRSNFPLRVNLIDTTSPLSIQVHPGSEVTEVLGYPQGVHELWFILESSSTSTIELGHRFVDSNQMKDALKGNQIRSYCNDFPVQKGESFHLYPGTMHAIGAGLLVYELTYNLDLTYRLFDYDRVDPQTGTKRTLHLDKAMAAVTFPQHNSFIEAIENQANGFEEKILVDELGVFTLTYWKINGSVAIPIDSFLLVTVIQGAGSIEDQHVLQYETVFVPATSKELHMIGEMTILAATFREKEEQP